MRAIVIDEHGGANVLRLRTLPARKPGPDQVLVDVVAAGVNYMDVGTREGYARGNTTLPLTLGVEGAGTIVAMGSEVDGLNVGDRVAWYFVWGSYAEQIVAPASALVPLPDEIGFETAAALMMQGLTASHLVFETYAMRPGHTALVHSAAGGVGLLLTQMIKQLGGKVIGRVSSPDKVEVVQSAGADAVITSTTHEFADDVLLLTAGDGVQVVYDGSGADTFWGSVAALGYHGVLAYYGPLFNPLNPIDLTDLPKSIHVTYPIVMHHVRTRTALLKRSAQLFDWVRNGKLKVRIGGRYTLADAARAHQDLQSRRTVGKLLLLPHAREGRQETA
ncbi:quinone oxidoreductase [Bradyrhizobium sp. MOS001]|jgi:NADPH2:quinone reductase|uniref:quinone oxidoreductase family protein n=1 Tax=Bradyrhizobium sp. MOS001 TaxID=2133948 RepID=UPI0010753C3B|nr:quinone oxidoreductase [Bradyrhizobium sp. MOS001]TFW56700.1 quinone oxidoreductase [Bradyrhizobium sp. MOS001]